MIREQRWTPDTCANPATGDACAFLETWDDTVPDVARTHNFRRAERLCSFHASLTGDAAYGRVRDENNRKNMVWRLFQEIRPGLKFEEFTWSYDASGLLTSSIARITPQERDQFKSLSDIQFGPNRVRVT